MKTANEKNKPKTRKETSSEGEETSKGGDESKYYSDSKRMDAYNHSNNHEQKHTNGEKNNKR